MFTSRKIRDQQRRRKHIFFGILLLGVMGVMVVIPKIYGRFELWNATRQLEQRQESFAQLEAEAFVPSSAQTVVQEGEQEVLEVQGEGEQISPEQEFLQRMEELSEENIPSSKILAVPFICQNPFQDSQGWDVHKESCEEAALLQSYLYLKGETVSVTEADRIFRDMIEWQEEPERFGAHIDLYGDDMERFIEEYYGLPDDHVVHLQNVDRDMIRKTVALGYPLIVPIKGELLRNPFYPEPGYHMLTVMGYSDEMVITNDVGTKRGEKYPYEWERFLYANQPVGNDAFVMLEIE